MTQCRADAMDLVGRDGLALAAPAKDDGEVGLARNRPARRGRAERRVVSRLVRIRPNVVHLVASGLQVFGYEELQRVARVVRTHGDAHRGIFALLRQPRSVAVSTGWPDDAERYADSTSA